MNCELNYEIIIYFMDIFILYFLGVVFVGNILEYMSIFSYLKCVFKFFYMEYVFFRVVILVMSRKEKIFVY